MSDNANMTRHGFARPHDSLLLITSAAVGRVFIWSWSWGRV